MKIPKIGLRILKSMLAVLVCLMIDVLLRVIFGDETALKYYSPFFAGLATIYSLNNLKDNSIKLAKIRSFGSILGGLFGTIFLYGVFSFLNVFSLVEGSVIYDLIRYIFVAFGVLLLIYIAVVLKLNHMIFIATLTFLAIAVGNRTDMPYYFYAINRTASTIIGVLVSLLVNLVSLHLYRNKHITFITSVDGILLRNNLELSSYQKFYLQNLLDDHLDLYINTSRSPATLIKLFSDIKIKHPLVVMNGSSTFDLESRQFSNIVNIDKETELKINSLLNRHQCNYFSHTIIDNTLQIYYRKLKHPGDQAFYHIRKNEYFRNFAKSAVPEDENVCYYIMIHEAKTTPYIIDELKKLELPIEITVNPYREIEQVEYFTIRITSNLANKLSAFNKIKQLKNHEVIVAFAANDADYEYFKRADYRLCFADAVPKIKEIADVILQSDNPEEVIKIIKKLYYAPKAIKKIENNNTNVIDL